MNAAVFHFSIGTLSCLALRDDNTDDYNILLVTTEQGRVLIDTGSGDAVSPPGRLLERLEGLGIAPAAIDVVILSHADLDHVGGSVDHQGAPVFPNARYVLTQDEWAFWTSHGVRFPSRDPVVGLFGEEATQLTETAPSTRVAQLQDKWQLIASDAEILPGIRALAAPGHTPGMIAIELTSGGDRLIFIADIYYGWDYRADPGDTPKLIGDPAWHAALDVDPIRALESRDRIFAYAMDNNALLMASHVHFPGLGHVRHHDAGWQWIPYVPGGATEE